MIINQDVCANLLLLPFDNKTCEVKHQLATDFPVMMTTCTCILKHLKSIISLILFFSHEYRGHFDLDLSAHTFEEEIQRAGCPASDSDAWSEGV